MKFHNECDLLKNERESYEKYRDKAYTYTNTGMVFTALAVSFIDQDPEWPMWSLPFAAVAVMFFGWAATTYFRMRIGQAESYTHANMDNQLAGMKSMATKGKYMLNNEAIQEAFNSLVAEHNGHFGGDEEEEPS